MLDALLTASNLQESDHQQRAFQLGRERWQLGGEFKR